MKPQPRYQPDDKIGGRFQVHPFDFHRLSKSREPDL
jgi:hypothetical protein